MNSVINQRLALWIEVVFVLVEAVFVRGGAVFGLAKTEVVSTGAEIVLVHDGWGWFLGGDKTTSSASQARACRETGVVFVLTR